MTRLFPLAGACALAGLIPHAPTAAQTVQDRAPAVTAPATPIAPDAMPDDQRYAVHGQATVVLQATPGFASPYAGTNSLTPRQAKETVDVTLYAGVRPWAGGELWVNPEIDQGFGLSNTLGVAGFPSAEAYKVGRNAPYMEEGAVNYQRQTDDRKCRLICVENLKEASQTLAELIRFGDVVLFENDLPDLYEKG